MRRGGWLLLLVAVHGTPAMADWVLEHEADFRRGARLDTGFWEFETGLQRNRERQYYQAANVVVADGVLRFEARRETVPNAAFRPGSHSWRTMGRQAHYTSGAIVSREPLQFGRVEVVARTPAGAGVWPAIWLVHESAQAYGEIDLFEYVGKHPQTVFAALHYGRDPRTRRHRGEHRIVPGFEGGWHTHAVEWTPSRITVLLDGEPLLTADPDEARGGGIDPLRQPMKLRINLALGGTWAGAIDDSRLPARFDIAAIRVWRWAPDRARAAGTAPADGVPVPAVAAPVERAQPSSGIRWGR